MALDEENLGLPEGMRRELKGMYTPRGAFPAGRDAEILRIAMRGRRGWSRWAMSAAVAAAVAIVAGGLWYAEWGRGSAEGGEGYARTGDVRDAFYLARELKAGKAMSEAWDVNGDGKVDEKDVRELAMAAVRIEGGVR